MQRWEKGRRRGGRARQEALKQPLPLATLVEWTSTRVLGKRCCPMVPVPLRDMWVWVSFRNDSCNRGTGAECSSARQILDKRKRSLKGINGGDEVEGLGPKPV